MINKLKNIPCQHCNKKGLRVREKITQELVLTEDNKLKRKTYWHVMCDYCSKMNKILWEEE